MIVAIDGPAGAGKSSVARAVAERFGFAYLDSGAMYRAVALAAAEQSLQLPHDEARVAATAESLPIRFAANGRRVFIADREVTDAIRTPAISDLSSRVSAIPAVRAAMVRQQRRLAAQCPGGAVLEGRDIQTVVCPDAQVKVFLTASAATRSARRLEQWRAQDRAVTEHEATQDVERRDRRDTHREVSPLQPAPDAVIINTDGLSLPDVIDRIGEIVRQRLDQQASRQPASR